MKKFFTMKECMQVVRERLLDAGVKKCPAPLVKKMAMYVQCRESFQVRRLPDGSVDVCVVYEGDKGQQVHDGFRLMKLSGMEDIVDGA